MPKLEGSHPVPCPREPVPFPRKGWSFPLACFSNPENRGWISSANSFAPPLIPPVSPIRTWPTSPPKSLPCAKGRKQWRHSSASTGKTSWPNKWTPCVRNPPQVAPSSSRKWANANFRLSKLSMTGTAWPFGWPSRKDGQRSTFQGPLPQDRTTSTPPRPSSPVRSAMVCASSSARICRSTKDCLSPLT